MDINIAKNKTQIDHLKQRVCFHHINHPETTGKHYIVQVVKNLNL